MGIVNGFCLLLVYQLAGEVIALYFALPIPGPVIGMLLLLAMLLITRKVPADMDDASGALLSHLSLLFVPAGVGVMVHMDLLGDEWLPILVALIVSTVASMALSAWAMKGLANLTRSRRDVTR
jgi:holin-like protein